MGTAEEHVCDKSAAADENKLLRNVICVHASRYVCPLNCLKEPVSRNEAERRCTRSSVFEPPQHRSVDSSSARLRSALKSALLPIQAT